MYQFIRLVSTQTYEEVIMSKTDLVETTEGFDILLEYDNDNKLIGFKTIPKEAN